MPGSVSDSYDPEFSTRANAVSVEDAIGEEIKKLNRILGTKRKNILQVVNGRDGDSHSCIFTERELRVIRFALARAAETI